MKVRVKGLGWLATATGLYEIQLVNGESLRGVINNILGSNRDILHRVLKDGMISSEIIVLVNGIDSRLSGGANTSLKDGDEITLVPVVHGG